MERRPLFGWWRFTEGVAASLTSPRTDIETADAAVRAAIRDSWLFAFSQHIVAAFARAWRTSTSRRVVERASSMWQGWWPAGRVRAVGAVIAVAMATALLLERLESPLDGPRRWILPVIVGLLGLVIAAAADPIARIVGGRRA
jgi:hypothetical protein